MNLFGSQSSTGKEKTRVQPGQFKESSMQSALIDKIYTRPLGLSTHRTTTIPMTRLEFQKVFLRFQLGRATAEDLLRYVYVQGWDAGEFVDANNIEIGEELL